MSITYQVGKLLFWTINDPEISSMQEATEVALRESESDQNNPFGIWTGQSHGSELVAIAYQGNIYRQ